jgi:succinylarginine dihydrolase
MNAREYNFDGLIGPTHNYAGLSLGNVASARNAGDIAKPRQAALQGLGKMRLLVSLGLGQGVLLPHFRPNLPLLHQLGFRGSPEAMIAAVQTSDPQLLRWVSSASAMWTANAATVSPSADTQDGRLHFTVANLAAMPHRAQEPAFTARLLRTIFADARHFAVHDALPGGIHFGDEGAANHGRFAASHDAAGSELFVYGYKPEGRYPARQTRKASEAVARLHGLDPARCLFVQQSSKAIEAGAFHNDVVSVTNGCVLFAHEDSFEHRDTAHAAMRAAVPGFQLVEVPSAAVPLRDAISSYLFNSQLVTMIDGSMALVMPRECAETGSTRRWLEALAQSETPIKHQHFIDVRESMRNGGGPACLRLRVVMSDAEAATADQRFIMDEAKISALEAWVTRCYPEEISPDMLADVALHRQCLTALDELTGLLGLGSLYTFQV